MDYLSPGLREGRRRLWRQFHRWRLWQRKRRLAKAETQLGLLGWQQADFDEETQRQVEAIQHVEREQSRLLNAAAEHAATLRRQRLEFEQAQRAWQEQRRALAAEERQAREPRVELERRLAERRRTEPNFERRIPELDRELREVVRMVGELLRTEPQTAKIRQELLRLRERSVSIPNEKSDLRTQHLRTVAEISSLEEQLATNLQAAADGEERLRRLDAAWSEQERLLTEQMKAEERERSRTEKQMNQLDRAKANPYQAIGRVLAETNLAPINQPEALERVKQLEYGIGVVRQALLESASASAAEDAAVLRISFALLGIAIFLLGLLLYALL